MTNEVRTVSATGGEKGVKDERLDLIPTEFLLMLSRIFAMGAAKYDDHNYLKGYEWSKSYAACQRHLLAFWGGEYLDPESRLPHLGHVAWHACALFMFVENNLGEDDRISTWLDAQAGELDRQAEEAREAIRQTLIEQSRPGALQ